MDIEIDFFDEKYLNLNSYNLILYDEIMIYEEVVFDMCKFNCVCCLLIFELGFVFSLNEFYLVRMVECMEMYNFVLMIEG